MKKGERRGKLVRTNTPALYVITAGGYHKAFKYEMQCDCGNITWVKPTNMPPYGKIISCGCTKAEINIHNGLGWHNGKPHPLYKVWESMLSRCYNPKQDGYENYGSRGITVCDEWRHPKTGFTTFYNWSTANGWQQGLQLDRINNDSNYEPSNCRFVTRSENCNNKRNNHLVTAFGETKTVTEWSHDPRWMMTVSGLNRRLQLDWDEEAAITTPSLNNHLVTAFGETKALTEWSHDPRCMMTVTSLRRRLQLGWDEEAAIATPSLYKQGSRNRKKFTRSS